MDEVKDRKSDTGISCSEELTSSVVEGDRIKAKSNGDCDEDELLAETKTVVDSFKECVLFSFL
jgi:hypothetical protein